MSGDTKNKLTSRKSDFSVIEKYIEDAKKGQKLAPDLVAAIMRPTDPVKEELRPIFSKLTKLAPKSQTSGFDPKVKSSKMGLPINPRQFLKRPTLFRDIWPR